MGILEEDSVLCPRDTTKLTCYGKGAFDEDGGYHRYDADFSKDFCIDDKPGSDRSEIRDGNDDRNVFIDPALRTGGLPDC